MRKHFFIFTFLFSVFLYPIPYTLYPTFAASPSDPEVIEISPINSSATAFTSGQNINTTILLNSEAEHFDAYFVDADAFPNPSAADAGSFTAIGGLTGKPAGTHPWTVPTTPGHYYFVVNAHTRVDHSINDWNPNATPADIGCAWDGKIYETPTVAGQPLLDTGNTCNNVGKQQFWVGTSTTASPSPNASANDPTDCGTSHERALCKINNALLPTGVAEDIVKPEDSNLIKLLLTKINELFGLLGFEIKSPATFQPRSALKYQTEIPTEIQPSGPPEVQLPQYLGGETGIYSNNMPEINSPTDQTKKFELSFEQANYPSGCNPITNGSC